MTTLHALSAQERIDKLERQLAEAHEEIDALVRAKVGLIEAVERLGEGLDMARAALRDMLSISRVPPGLPSSAARLRYKEVVDAAHAALEAKEVAVGGMWQPIETAPKDGTAVLLAGGCDDYPNFLLNHLGEFVRSPCRAMWDGDSWTMAFAEAGYISVEYVDPTHWQPLPRPPQGISKPEFPDGLKSVLRSG